MKKIVSGEEKMDPPDTGFFNAGQKIQFWEIVGGCVVYLITGIILWAGARTFGRIAVAISYVLHDISALIMLGGIFIHIYQSTIRRTRHFPGNGSRRRKRSLGLDLPSRLVQASHRTRPAASLRRSPPPNDHAQQTLAGCRETGFCTWVMAPCPNSVLQRTSPRTTNQVSNSWLPNRS